MTFSDFWDLYPRHVAKSVALKAWNKLPEPNKTAALEGLERYIRYWKLLETEKHFIPHPSTWLNQARWEDELELTPRKKTYHEQSAEFIAELTGSKRKVEYAIDGTAERMD